MNEYTTVLNKPHVDMGMYQAILNELNSLGIGHDRHDDIGMHLLCGYHNLTITQYEQIRRKGQLLYSVFGKINSLYKRAIVEKDEYLLNLFENGILENSKARKLHRELFLKRSHKLPVLFRGDMPNLEQFVEFHSGLRGMGYLNAFRKVMDKHNGVHSLLNYRRLQTIDKLFVEILKQRNEHIAIMNASSGISEVDYFLHQVINEPFIRFNQSLLESMRRGSNVLFGKNDEDISNFTLLQVSPRHVYWNKVRKDRSILKSLVKKIIPGMYGNSAIIKGYLNEYIDIEPPPNLLYENKIVLAVVHDVRYKEYFTEEERGIFPETYIVKQNGKIAFADKEYSLQDIIDLPMRKRLFIIKYAGLNLRTNYGGSHVFSLKKLSKKGTADLLQRATVSFARHKEPWIIQRDISTKDFITYYDRGESTIKSEALYKLYRPYFLYNPERDDMDIMDILVFFRKRFKVHAQRDCICGLVSIDNKEI